MLSVVQTDPHDETLSQVAGSDEIPVIYIMGSGRSGSTFLGIALGQHPEVGNFGELINMTRKAWRSDSFDETTDVDGGNEVSLSSRSCSCGDPAWACSFWTAVRNQWMGCCGDLDIENYDRCGRSLLPGRRLPRLLRDIASGDADLTAHLLETRGLLQAIREVSGCRVLVDSSKSPSRALLLSLVPGVKLYLIHLVRDARAVCWSNQRDALRQVKMTPAGRRMASPLSAGFWWTTMQLHSAAVRRRVDASQSLRVRYEEVVSKPADVLDKIGALVGLDYSEPTSVITSGAPVQVGHVVAGNDMRLGVKVRLKPDFDWRDRMSRRDQRLVASLSGWLMLEYGYSR